MSDKINMSLDEIIQMDQGPSANTQENSPLPKMSSLDFKKIRLNSVGQGSLRVPPTPPSRTIINNRNHWSVGRQVNDLKYPKAIIIPAGAQIKQIYPGKNFIPQNFAYFRSNFRRQDFRYNKVKRLNNQNHKWSDYNKTRKQNNSLTTSRLAQFDSMNNQRLKRSSSMASLYSFHSNRSHKSNYSNKSRMSNYSNKSRRSNFSNRSRRSNFSFRSQGSKKLKRPLLNWKIQQEIAVLQVEGRKKRIAQSPLTRPLQEILDSFTPTPAVTEFFVTDRFASYYA